MASLTVGTLSAASGTANQINLALSADASGGTAPLTNALYRGTSDGFAASDATKIADNVSFPYVDTDFTSDQLSQAGQAYFYLCEYIDSKGKTIWTNQASATLQTTGGSMSTVTIAPNAAGISYSPENWNVTAGAAITANSGAYFNFGFAGTSLALNCTVGANPPYLAISVDWQPPQIVQAAATVTVAMPSRTSAWSQHTCEVVVLSGDITVNRWSTPPFTLTGIVLASGTVSAIAARYSKKILVFGDSLTEGFQTIAAVSSAANSVTNTDASLGWAYGLRAALGAEVGVIGFTGQGIAAAAPANNGS
ncbi:SGNH/GDSL hydrolase family protein, partial [Kozakia baliensis]|uniref:hypothetical protein n=1 Tax=Kozakia baliensis TaxID=153496 RepID=UPI000496D076